MWRLVKRLQTRLPGRPPAGRDGMSVTEAYVQTTLRLDPETTALLDALTRLLGCSQRQVAGEALSLFANQLSPPDRALLEGLLNRRK